MIDQPTGISTACTMATPDGLTPLGWLKIGDLIETRDHGFQPIQNIAPAQIGLVVQIDGVGNPILAGQRLLACGWAVQMYFGVDEMLATAGHISSPTPSAPDQNYAQITMATPMLLRMNDVWIESHGGCNALHPVLTLNELKLTQRTFGCPLARDPIDMPMMAAPDLADISSTFGSRSAAA